MRLSGLRYVTSPFSVRSPGSGSESSAGTEPAYAEGAAAQRAAAPKRRGDAPSAAAKRPAVAAPKLLPFAAELEAAMPGVSPTSIVAFKNAEGKTKYAIAPRHRRCLPSGHYAASWPKYARQMLWNRAYGVPLRTASEKMQKVLERCEDKYAWERPYQLFSNAVQSYPAKPNRVFEHDGAVDVFKTTNARSGMEKRFGADTPLPNHAITFEASRKTGGVAAWAQGERKTMEDAHIASWGKVVVGGKARPIALHGVFDGHRRARKAQKSAKRAKKILEKKIQLFNPEQITDSGMSAAFTTAMQEMSWKRRAFSDGGTTANLSVVIGEDLYTANVGDSWDGLVLPNETVYLSEDADPTDPKYCQTVLKNGGYVENGRVGDFVALSRALGDDYVDGMTAKPTITHINLLDELKKALPSDGSKTLKDIADKTFLVHGCDGLIESGTREQVTGLVRDLSSRGFSLRQIAAEVVKAASLSGSKDNMTVQIVPASKLLAEEVLR